MTYDGINIGEAVQPIQDRVETYQSNGYAVISPGDSLSAGAYAVTVNSGNLDASDTLSVGSSNDGVLFDGSTKSLSSSTNVRINSVSSAGDGTEQYRYDVIYTDSSGEVQKTEGSVTKLDSRESQNNLTRFERFKAAIPNPGTDPSVIIAAVIVNSNDSSVGTGQLRDYRVSATHKVSTLEAETTQNTNETFIKLARASASASTTAGNFINIADVESKDVRGESSNAQITPDRTGQYLINAEPEFDGGTADGDNGAVRLRDVDNNGTVGPNETRYKIAQDRGNSVTLIRELTAGTTYEVQGTNFDNDFKIGPLSLVYTTRLLTA